MNKFSWGRRVAIVASCVLLDGCASLPAVTSGQIGCPESEITITKDEMGWATRTWTAACHGRTYFCSAHGGGQNSPSQVSCKESSDADPHGSSTQPARDDAPAAVCDAAYKRAAEFAPYWVAHRDGGKLLDPLPDARDFAAVCTTLPANIQRCIFEPYRRAHEKSCDAMLSRVDAATRDKIDSLFLEARSANAPR